MTERATSPGPAFMWSGRLLSSPGKARVSPVKPKSALGKLTLIMTVTLLVIQLTQISLTSHAEPATKVALEFNVEAPLPGGLTPISVAMHEGEGIAVLGINSDGRIALIYYSREGSLQWSLLLEGMEPVSVFSSDGYIHAVTRFREGATELVRYYRISPEGEIMQDYETVVARAALVYEAVRVPTGILLVGVKYDAETGRDPMAALLVPGTGVTWVAEASLPGDQRPINTIVNGVLACTLYITENTDKASVVCIDSATGEVADNIVIPLSGVTENPVLLPGNCILYTSGQGLAATSPDQEKAVILTQDKPERVTNVAISTINGEKEQSIVIVFGVQNSRPWAGIALLREAQACPEKNSIITGTIGSQGLVPISSDAVGDTVAVALASQNYSLVAAGRVIIEEVDEPPTTLPEANSGEQAVIDHNEKEGANSNSENGNGLFTSPIITGILLATLLVIIAVVVAARKRRAIYA